MNNKNKKSTFEKNNKLNGKGQSKTENKYFTNGIKSTYKSFKPRDKFETQKMTSEIRFELIKYPNREWLSHIT